MEVTLETLYQKQQSFEQKLVDFEQKLGETKTSIVHDFERELAHELAATKASIIQWVVGLFIGAMVVIGASVTLATTAVMLVTR